MESTKVQVVKHRCTNIVPRHPRSLKNRHSISNKVSNILEIKDTCVVVILTWEECATKFSWVNISQRVVVSVPTPEAQIDTPDTGKVVIHDHDLQGISEYDPNPIC